MVNSRPHPEERACGVGAADWNARTRVSKDEDKSWCALMLRDASQRSAAVAGVVLAWRCVAPQHEGGRGPCVLAEQTHVVHPHDAGVETYRHVCSLRCLCFRSVIYRENCNCRV